MEEARRTVSPTALNITITIKAANKYSFALKYSINGQPMHKTNRKKPKIPNVTATCKY